MRVVDVNEFYAPRGGGVRSYIDRKMAIMADLGHELIVVAPAKADSVEERPGGGRIIWVTAPGMPFDKNYGLFWEAEPIHALLDELKPDVVEASSPWRPAWIVGEWQGDAVKSFFMHNDNITSYPGRWFGNVAPKDAIERAFDWYNNYMRRFLGPFDILVSNGPSLKKRLEARGIGPVISMPLGIEREHFSPGLRDETLRAQLLAQCGLGPEAVLLIGIGRFHGEKRWPMVIDAVEAAGSEFEVGLVLIGGGPDKKTIEKHARHSPHVRLFNPVTDRRRLATILASADAMIHGCESETFGLVTSEGLASGLPLIVPDEGGAFEMAQPAFAETYTAKDGRAAAAAVRRMLGEGFGQRRSAALIAAETVRSDREHALELMELYAGLVARKAAAS